jgi:hypothetical protein
MAKSFTPRDRPSQVPRLRGLINVRTRIILPLQVKKMFEVFEQTYGKRPVNQDKMAMWLKSSESRAHPPSLDLNQHALARLPFDSFRFVRFRREFLHEDNIAIIGDAGRPICNSRQ